MVIGTASGCNKRIIQTLDLAGFTLQAKSFISSCGEMNESWLTHQQEAGLRALGSSSQLHQVSGRAGDFMWEPCTHLLGWTWASSSHATEMLETLRLGSPLGERSQKPSSFVVHDCMHVQDALDCGWLMLNHLFPTRCCRRNQTYWKCPAGRGERRREQGGPRKCLNIKKWLPVAPPSLPLSSILPSCPDLDLPPSCSRLWACPSLSHSHLNPFSLCVANI